MEKVNKQVIRSLTKLSAREVVGLIGVGITLLLFWKHSSEYFWIETIFLLEILAVTWFTRSIGVRYALAVFSQGVLMCFLMILLWNIFYMLGFEMDSATWSGVIIPMIEEILKVAPAVLAAWWLYKKKGTILNISDWVTLTAMGGIGFSILEKYFWDNVTFPFTYGPHLGSWYLFPDALGVYIGGEAAGYIGHGAAAGLIGLGIGLGLYVKHKVNGATAWWWALPGTTVVWVVAEHMFNNMYYINGSETILTMGGGQLTPWLFILLLIVGLVIEIKTARGFLKAYPSAAVQLRTARGYVKDSFSQAQWSDLPPALLWLVTHRRVINALSWKLLLTKSI